MKIKYKTIICKIISSAITASLLFSLFACGKSADQEETLSAENDSVYSEDEFSEDRSEDSEDYSEDTSEDRGENTDSTRKYWINSKNETIVNQVWNNLFTTKQLLNSNVSLGLLANNEKWITCSFSKQSANNIFNNLKFAGITASVADPIRINPTTKPTSPIDVTIKADNKDLAVLTFKAYDYIPQKSNLADPNSPTAYLILQWKEGSESHVALVEVYAAIDPSNSSNTNNSSSDDMGNYWRNVIKPCDKDHFYVIGADAWIDYYPIDKNGYGADAFCFFNKSDADACVKELSNDKYQPYEETELEESYVEFNISNSDTKDPYKEIHKKGGDWLCYLYLKNRYDVPRKSDLPGSVTTAWLVITWLDQTDSQPRVAEIEVKASK